MEIDERGHQNDVQGVQVAGAASSGSSEAVISEETFLSDTQDLERRSPSRKRKLALLQNAEEVNSFREGFARTHSLASSSSNSSTYRRDSKILHVEGQHPPERNHGSNNGNDLQWAALATFDLRGGPAPSLGENDNDKNKAMSFEDDVGTHHPSSSLGPLQVEKNPFRHGHSNDALLDLRTSLRGMVNSGDESRDRAHHDFTSLSASRRAPIRGVSSPPVYDIGQNAFARENDNDEIRRNLQGGNESDVGTLLPLPHMKLLSDNDNDNIIEDRDNDEEAQVLPTVRSDEPPRRRAARPCPHMALEVPSLVKGEAMSPATEDAHGSHSDQDSDSDPNMMRRKILLSAIAAVLSSLADILTGVGQVMLLLENAILEKSIATSASASASTATSTTSCCESESLLARYHKENNRRLQTLSLFSGYTLVLMQLQQRKQQQRPRKKTPREMTGPWYIKPRLPSRRVVGESFLDFSPQTVDPEKFRKLFRVSPQLFHRICHMVSAEMLSDTPVALRCLPNRVLTVQRQVAIALKRLATGDQFVGIADSFGVSKSTAVKVTWKFVLAFIKKARQLVLRWPAKEGDEMHQVKEAFRSRWGLPNCCGAMDGTHFMVEFAKGEDDDVSAYLDHQNHVSITMQAIVAPDLRFLDVVVGFPGSVRGFHLLQSCNFYHSSVNGRDRLDGEPFVARDGSFIREYVIGNAGYPLHDWLMVPYRPGDGDGDGGGLTAAEEEWNERLAGARGCVAEALVRLKGTWKILSRILWKPRKERIGKMVFACCLLHNMIIQERDGLDPSVYTGVKAHPGGYEGFSSAPMSQEVEFEGGMEARAALLREVVGGKGRRGGGGVD